jgi:hypothetical protein
MKLLWTPILAAAVVALAACEQRPLVGPSAETSVPPHTLAGPLAVQTGNGAPSGGHYSLNIIGVPRDKTATDMTGNNGHRIFVLLTGSTKIMLSQDSPESPGFAVLDANGTDGVASFQLPSPDPDGDGTTVYSVFARALGKPLGKSVTTTCATDPDDGLPVCSGISLTLERKKGQSVFENVSKYLLYIYADVTGDGVVDRVPLFDNKLQGYFWDYDQITGLKLAQLRFYQCPSTVPAPTDPGGPTTTTCF